MKSKTRKRVLVVVGLLVLIALAFPVSNLLVGRPYSTKLAAVPATDPLFARARAILQDKCTHCHAEDTAKPFYAVLPVAGPLIRHDVARGLQYLDLTESFVVGTDVPQEVVLAKIEHALQENSMPPISYAMMHWNSPLSSSDKEVLLQWVRETRVKHYATPGLPVAVQERVIQPLPQTSHEDPQKVALGKELYNDKRLSKDGTLSCAGCHGLDEGGTNRKPVGVGVGGAKGPINVPTVFNAVFNVAQFWDGRAADLQEQADGPITNPIEMGGNWKDAVARLQKDQTFYAAFKKAYPAGLSKDTITDAIATYERTLITPGSPFDRYLMGHSDALTADQKEGYKLFLDTGCATCHCGKAMGGQSYELMGREEDYFAQRGGPITRADAGRYNVTKKESDRHKFKVPTLRNVALTYPYFHDASAKDLSTAVRVMARVQYGKELSPDQIAKIVQFLQSLTGELDGKPLGGAPAAKAAASPAPA